MMTMAGNEESCESNTSAINAFRDLTGTLSECSLKIIEQPKINFTLNDEISKKDCNGINEMADLLYDLSLKEKLPDSINETEQKSSVSNYFIRSPPLTSQEFGSSRENSENETNISYTSDFRQVSSTCYKDEMTAWEKWFVMKQEQIRRKSEMERKRLGKNQKEMQRQEALKQKKKEENEANRKLWLARKKREMEEKEKERELKEREKRLKGNSEYTFEYWNLKKYQQKKADLLHRDYIKKKEEEEKKKKSKQSEEAVKRWMSKAKHRPLTPRITYAYCGGSAISFYDSTRPPSPTYVNPIPWQDPCLTTSH